MPDFGQRLILRFDSITGNAVPHAELDKTVTLMRQIAEPDTWVTLTDPHQRKSDVNIATRLQRIDEVLGVDMLVFQETQHTVPVMADAKVIRDALNLDDTYRIWEIEAPVHDIEASPEIRIIDTGDCGEGFSTRRETQTVMFNERLCTIVFLKNNPSFQGCLKANYVARAEHMTLLNYITRFNSSY